MRQLTHVHCLSGPSFGSLQQVYCCKLPNNKAVYDSVLMSSLPSVEFIHTLESLIWCVWRSVAYRIQWRARALYHVLLVFDDPGSTHNRSSRVHVPVSRCWMCTRWIFPTRIKQLCCASMISSVNLDVNRAWRIIWKLNFVFSDQHIQHSEKLWIIVRSLWVNRLA